MPQATALLNFLPQESGLSSCFQQVSLCFSLGPLGGPKGFPGGANGKETICQCRRLKRGGFNPWVRKIPWRRAWQPTPVFFPGESHAQRSLAGYSPWGQRGGHNWATSHTLMRGGPKASTNIFLKVLPATSSSKHAMESDRSRARSGRALQIITRTLDFNLSKKGNNWRM